VTGRPHQHLHVVAVGQDRVCMLQHIALEGWLAYRARHGRYRVVRSGL
jgi:hypothetical protein